ncbi:MAG TPA: hypothetical protein VK971_03075 [Thiohalobacter sp.]|nr:hypothetical protein [Thiohalobacter sp.]
MASRTAIDQAIAGIMKFTRRPPWEARFEELLEEFLARPAQEFECSPGDVLERVDGQGMGHMLYGMVLEQLMTLEYEEPPHNLIDDYLKRRGWKERPAGRAYLRQLRGSQLGFYEVVDVEPGSHVVIRPAATPDAEPLRVRERQGSRGLYRWDHLAARVLESGGERRFSGAFLPFQGELAESALAVLESTRSGMREMYQQETLRQALAEKGLDGLEQGLFLDTLLDAELDEALPLALTQLWLIDLLGRLEAPLPSLVTREGDTLVFGEARLDLPSDQRAAVAAALDALADWERAEADAPFWRWLPAEDTERGVDGHPAGEDARQWDTQAPDGRSIVAEAEIEGEILALRANSRPRMARALAALKTTCGDRLGPPAVTYTSVEEALAQREQAADAPSPSHAEPSLPPAEQAAFVAAWKDRHYRETLDTPVPALDDRSPRECVADPDPEARRALLAWLKQLENHEQRTARRSGEPTYDTRWLWDELDLDPDTA